MSSIFILDANVFLELPYEEGNFCEECDNVFGMPNQKRTTQGIMTNEITPIHEERLLILNDIQIFYEKNKGSKKFPAKRRYFQTTFEFKDTILNKIVAKDSKQILRSVRTTISLIKKMMQYRIKTLTGKLIQTYMNKPLHNELIKIMNDKDDAQHIIDASFWANTNGNSDFISLNREHLAKHENNIKQCVCAHNGWARCNIDFTHPEDY